ncbi:MAG: Na+/H+ antiporter subunit D [Akkermansiaceae bacterium]
MIPLLCSIIIPFITALVCLSTGKNPQLTRKVGVFGAIALLASSCTLLYLTILNGHVVIQAGSWGAPYGITLIADLFSASMVCITSIVGLAVAIYSIKDINDSLIKKHYFALFHFLIMGVNGAFITGDLFNLYVWFEVMLISSFVLITMGGKRGQLEGGVKYLIINLLSSIIFLSGLGLLYGKLGTLNMADVARLLAQSDDAFLVNSSAMLLLAAFAIKAALFPFFFWLPASYHTPKVAISAIFAGLLTKVGVYALIRAYTLFFSSQFDVIQGTLLFLSAATMITGVLGAAAQYDIRKILSFHIVSQIGYIMMGLAIGTTAAITGAIFYTIHHIIVKTNLFLISGLIKRKCGSTDLKKIGGLYRFAPALSLLFFIPAFSLGGIPPLSGFWAKFSVIQAGITEGHYILVTSALLVGVLTLYSMTKIWAEAFWKDAPDNQKLSTTKLPLTLTAPCIGLALLTVAIGLWSTPLFNLAEAASLQLMNPEIYINKVFNTNPIQP